MMFKKIILTTKIIIVLTICCGIVGCDAVLESENTALATETPSVADVKTPVSQEPSLTEIPTPMPLKKVGISMLSESYRWNYIAGSHMKQQLEKLGYMIDVQYANDDDVDVQISQLEMMIHDNCDILVVESSFLFEDRFFNELKLAKEKGIPIIAYNSYFILGDVEDVISYGIIFSRWDKSFEMSSQYIESALSLPGAEGELSIELFLGDPSYNSYQYSGTLDILQPYFESGKLKIPSGEKAEEEISTEDFSFEKAKRRMKRLINSQNYSPNGEKLDAVFCASDSIAQGVTQALLDAGYTADNFPVITGKDGNIQSVKNIIDGTQSMTIFYDGRVMAERAVKMIDDILNNRKPEINDTSTYGNERTYLCDPVVVTKENYREVLIDSGYYTEEEING